MKPMLEVCDQEAMQCYLETNKESNVSLYEHYGFSLMKEELIPKNKKFSRYIKIENEWQLKKKQNNRCFRIFGGAVIAADGNVLPCCYDKSSTHTMGNVFNKNFKNIWQGEQFTEFRKQVFYNRKQFEICKNCNE